VNNLRSLMSATLIALAFAAPSVRAADENPWKFEFHGFVTASMYYQDQVYANGQGQGLWLAAPTPSNRAPCEAVGSFTCPAGSATKSGTILSGDVRNSRFAFSMAGPKVNLGSSEQGGEGHRQQHCRQDRDVDRISQPPRRGVPQLRRRQVPHGGTASPRASRHFRRRPLLDRSAQVLGLGLVQEPSPLLHELPRHRRRRAAEVDSVRLELERHSAPPRLEGRLTVSGGRSGLSEGTAEGYDVSACQLKQNLAPRQGIPTSDH